MTTAPTSTKLSIWDRLLRLDRRWIYLLLAACVIVPLFARFAIRPRAMPPVVSLFSVIESLPEERAVVISADYSPDTQAELHPMTIALLRHVLARRAKVAVMSLDIQGIGLADAATRQVVDEFNARARSPDESLRYGLDYVVWSFQTPPLLVITGMGEDVLRVFPTDAYGNRTDSLPISEGLRSYNNIEIVISIAGSSVPLWWVTYGQTVFGVKVGTGITAVSAADFYPYYSKTRQFSGILAGMKGAAEYEELVRTRYPEVDVGAVRHQASESMASQTAAHLGIMLLIVIGNVAFFASRKRRIS